MEVPTEECFNCCKKFKVGDTAYLSRREKITVKGTKITREIVDVAVCEDCR